jgi:hypothetical protein
MMKNNRIIDSVKNKKIEQQRKASTRLLIVHNKQLQYNESITA